MESWMYRLWPDGTVEGPDDFDRDNEKYDDYQDIHIPVEIINYIQECS